MSGEPSTRELASQLAAFKDLMDERDKRYDAQFKAQETAVAKYDANAEKWRANANEWRAAMTDREQKFAGRAEMDSKFEAVRTAIDSLKETRSEHQGRSQISAPLLVAISGAFGGLIVYIVQQALTLK